MAWIFGLDAPGCWIGRPVTAAFGPAVITARSLQKETPGRNCVTEPPLVIAAGNRQE
jgi:hypothetical protein